MSDEVIANIKGAIKHLRRLLADNDAEEPKDWPLPEKMRLLAVAFDLSDDDVSFEGERMVQDDLRHAADMLDEFGYYNQEAT